MFRKTESYTREDISTAVGGGLRDCLSHSGNRVVAICMRKEMNPEAPLVLLVGEGPQKKKYSEILCRDQKNDPVPIFIKQPNGSWKFHGNYKVKNNSVEPALIKRYQSKSGRTDVQMVIHFTEV
ncbi:MAG TPA: hypothetical protein VGJ94_06730 [Syntrophorhabdaceae bacterium]|jgi:hypothetical protein